MDTMKRMSTGLHSVVLGLACASSAFAADPATPQPYAWPWWREMQWPGFGWVFPLACFAMTIVMLLFMVRKGAMCCMRRGRSTGRPGLHESMIRSPGGPSASALAILDERYAKGEIDKQEYEEKKAAIASSG